jgi:non-heme Fe2+,alpha-ketoglutarate-dependent halogenase
MAALSRQETEFFEANGYVGPFTLRQPGEMNRVREHIDRDLLVPQRLGIGGWDRRGAVGESDYYTLSPIYSMRTGRDRHLDSLAVFDLLTHPAIHERVASLLGPDLVLWRSSSFIKGPGGRKVVWHQDFDFSSVKRLPALDPVRNVTAWVAVDDTNVDNGCVQLLPGTHRGPAFQADRYLEEASFWCAGIRLDDAGRMSRLTRGPGQVVNMPLKAGQFFLFSDLTIHGSPANTSKRRRFGFACRFTSADVTIYPDDQEVDGHGYLLDRYQAIQCHGEGDYQRNPFLIPRADYRRQLLAVKAREAGGWGAVNQCGDRRSPPGRLAQGPGAVPVGGSGPARADSLR